MVVQCVTASRVVFVSPLQYGLIAVCIGAGVKAVQASGGSICEGFERFMLAELCGIMRVQNRGVTHGTTIENLNVDMTYTREVRRVRRRQLVFVDEEPEALEDARRIEAMTGKHWLTCRYATGEVIGGRFYCRESPFTVGECERRSKPNRWGLSCYTPDLSKIDGEG